MVVVKSFEEYFDNSLRLMFLNVIFDLVINSKLNYYSFRL